MIIYQRIQLILIIDLKERKIKMEQALKKILTYTKQIRRRDREKIKHKMRNQFFIHEKYEQFLTDRPNQISEQLIQNFEEAPKNIKEKIIKAFQYSSFNYSSQRVAHQIKEDWIFSCRSKNNIKFFTILAESKIYNFHEAFFTANLLQYEQYIGLEREYKLFVKNSQCYIQSIKIDPESFSSDSYLINRLKDPFQKETILTNLQFWSIYIQKQDDFIIQDFQKIATIFLIWLEHAEIQTDQRVYKFIYSYMILIQQSKVMNKQSKLPITLKEISKLFIRRVQRLLPFALYRLNFEEIGLILVQLVLINQQCEVIDQLKYRLDTIGVYLDRMFFKENQSFIKNAIRVLSILQEESQILELKDDLKKKIYTFIANQLIHRRDTAYQSLVCLYSLSKSDFYSKMTAIFENIDYMRLSLRQTTHNSVQLDFFIGVLFQYSANDIISTQLLVKCQLDRLLIKAIEKGNKNQSIFIDFIKALNIQLSYYADNYPNILLRITQYTKENIEFQAKDEFLSEAEKFLSLKYKEDLL